MSTVGWTRNYNNRRPELHRDSRILKARIVAFLAKHPHISQQALSMHAGLGKAYVSSIMCEYRMEAKAEKAMALERSMRYIEKHGL